MISLYGLIFLQLYFLTNFFTHCNLFSAEVMSLLATYIYLQAQYGKTTTLYIFVQFEMGIQMIQNLL